MASSNGRSRWYHQGFSNRWFRIFIVSKTSKKEIGKFLYWVKRIFSIHTWYWILDSRYYILNNLILSLSIDKTFLLWQFWCILQGYFGLLNHKSRERCSQTQGWWSIQRSETSTKYKNSEPTYWHTS